MKTFDSATLAMLASGRAATRAMLLLELGSGLYGFWTGLGTLTHNSVDYIGAGQLISIEPLGLGMDLAAVPIVVRLNAVPNSALTPDVLASIESEQYHQRPVVLSRAYIDPASRALLSVERLYRGYIDRIEHEDKVPLAGESGGAAALVCYLESKARDHQKRGHRLRSDTDQRRVAADDGGLRYAALVGDQEIVWGRGSGSPAQRVKTRDPNSFA